MRHHDHGFKLSDSSHGTAYRGRRGNGDLAANFFDRVNRQMNDYHHGKLSRTQARDRIARATADLTVQSISQSMRALAPR